MQHRDDPITVLHVDDDADFVELSATLIEREDSRLAVDTATSADEGLGRLAENEFDCVVSDYDMPRQNGIEFLRAVRADYPKLPFILFTGKGDEDIASKAITAGVTDYLQKEDGTEQYALLANRIRNAVDRVRTRRQIDLRQQALETADEGLSLIDPEGRFLYVNSAFAELFGYDQDELVGSGWSSLYHDGEAARLETEILPAVQETGYWSGETVRLTKDGERLVTDHRLTRAAGDTIVCTAKDLTEERAAHSGQREAGDLILDTIGGEGYAFFALDHEGYVTRWSDRANQLYGYESGDILGRHLSVLSADADREKGVLEDLLETAWRDGSVTHEGDLLTGAGSRRRTKLVISADCDADGTLRGFGVIAQEAVEATAEGGHAERLRQTRAKLAALFEESPDLINFHDADGTITDPNPELCRETGYDAATLTEMKVWELDEGIGPEEARTLWQNMDPGDRYRTEGVYRRKDGSTFPVEAHIRRLGFDQNDLFVVAARDMTDQKEREQELRRERDRLEEFAGVVSHDLRNPLHLADGHLELAREESDSSHLDAVSDALTRMDRIIEDVLKLARQGEQIGSVEPVSLGEAVDTAWDVAAHGATEADLRYGDDDRPLPTIEASAERLQQLLENLFSNAIDHAGPDVAVTVGRLDDGFYVEDDGPGIPEDVREEVFTAGHTTAEEGTGFGLSIVKQVAEAHGWEVIVTDGAGDGARFEVTGVTFLG